MEKWLQDQLRVQAEEIRDAVRGGKLYGHPIDTDNVDMMIVAAYCLAMDRCTVRTLDEIELADSIRL